MASSNKVSARTDDEASSTAELKQTVLSTTSLLQNFTKALEGAETTLETIPEDSPDPLDVLHTASTLLKAHTTKLSLLIINKPFTASAIRKVIVEVTSSCVPAMMSAVEICQPLRYGQTLHDEVKTLTSKVFRELDHVMQELLHKLESLSQGNKASTPSGRDSLTSTGVLWSTCDRLIELKSLGLGGLAVRKALLYKSMLEDAIAELQEWAEDDDEEEDGDADFSDGANSIEELFEKGSKIPKDRADIRESLESALRKMKQLKSLYNSVVKHRLRTFSTSTFQEKVQTRQRVDKLMDHLARIPEQVDELAGSLYELDNDEASKMLTEICETGKRAAILMKANWAGNDDDFTTWAGVWLDLIDQA